MERRRVMQMLDDAEALRAVEREERERQDAEPVGTDA
jgi:hypothetical protein